MIRIWHGPFVTNLAGAMLLLKKGAPVRTHPEGMEWMERGGVDYLLS